MLAELMLAHLLPWSKLHEEAHKLEHAISPLVEDALFRDFDSPRLCLHGNPLPGNEEAVSRWVPLTRTTEGDRVIIRRIHEFGKWIPSILIFLEENEICLGKEVSIHKILPFTQTVNVCVGDHEVSLGFAVAHFVYGERSTTE
jgi:DtxR family Mn-dependent transcriptional regulator